MKRAFDRPSSDASARLASKSAPRSIYPVPIMRDFLLSPGASGGGDAARRYHGDSETDTESRAGSIWAHARTRRTGLRLRHCEAEVDATPGGRFWQTAFQWTPAEEKPAALHVLLYEQLVPRRTTMLQIADRIAEINERGLNRAEGRLSASAENLRSSLLVTFRNSFAGRHCAGGRNYCADPPFRAREVERRLKENSRSARGPAGPFFRTARARAGG